MERVTLQPGQTLELPDAAIAWGPTWGDALLPYRHWLASIARRPLPFCDWYWNGNFVEQRYAHCLAPTVPAKPLHWVFDNHHRAQTVQELCAQVDQAFVEFEPRGLTPLFYQFGWWERMATCRGTFAFDAVCGDYTQPHALTRPVIDYLHRRGARTFLYTNFISAGEDTDVYRNQPQLFARDARGFPVRNGGYPMYLFCPGAPGMRDYWERILQCILVDLDADGLFLDQLGGGTPCAYCYDPTHHHDHPDVYGRDYLDLLDWVCRRARALKPDCFLGGELTADLRSMWVDQMHGVGYARPRDMTFTSISQARETPPSEYFAFMSYLNPLIAHLPSGPEFIARGCPGTADIALWNEHRDLFRAGLRPCVVEPVGGIAYLFGPVQGEAILATLAWEDLGPVTVRLPVALRLRRDEGEQVDACTVRVTAGKAPSFYRLTP